MKPKFNVYAHRAIQFRISQASRVAVCTLSTLTTLVLSGASTAVASTIVIDGPTTETNGGIGNVVNGDDSITVTETGRISARFGYPGIRATGAKNIITNNGSIVETGPFVGMVGSNGILAGNNSTITNSGSITGSGGIGAGNNSEIVNSGSIEAIVQFGGVSFGVRVGNKSTVNNSGSITGSTGIKSGDDSKIKNNGSIEATDPSGGNGILVGDQSTVNNSGSITGSTGIKSGDDSKIKNSGSIEATAPSGGNGILVGDQSTVNNSGLITGSSGIVSGDNSKITNSGSIETMSQFGGSGIFVGDKGTVNNSGSITGSSGIESGDDSKITNSGSIETMNTIFGSGILVGDNGRVNNSGSIETISQFSGSGILVGDNSTVNNSGSILGISGIESGDNCKITNSGSIGAKGGFSLRSPIGIMAGSSSEINNSGSISVINGSFGQSGIIAGAKSKVTNSGSITSEGGFSSGAIIVGNQSSIDNSGVITSSARIAGPGLIFQGDMNSVVEAGNNSTISNSGLIVSTSMISSGDVTIDGDLGSVIEVGDNSTITNSGSITASSIFDRTAIVEVQGDLKCVIKAGANSSVTNSGSIDASGEIIDAIRVGDNSSITNTGSITTAGKITKGITAGNNSTITSSGLVVSQQAEAFDLASRGTLNLIAPTFIGGTIALGANATVNITTGASHSILWDFDGTMLGGAPNLIGALPMFYDDVTQKVATFDPTGLAAQSDELADLGGAIAGLIAHRSVDFNSPAEVQTSNPGSQNSGGFSPASQWWGAGFGSTADYDGNAGTLDRDSTNTGLAIGYEHQLAPDFMLGALGGWNVGKLDASSAFSNSMDRESDGVFAAFHGRVERAEGFIDFAFMGGLMSHEDSRFVNDSLAPLGRDSASASYDSIWIAPQVGIGRTLSAPYDWTLTPYASLRWAFQSFEGYSETGSAGNATVDDRDIDVIEARAQILSEKRMKFGEIGLRAGIQFRSAGNDEATVTMLGQTQNVSSYVDDSTSAFIGASFDYSLSENSKLGIEVEGISGGKMASVLGGVRFVASF
jgi:hypothetical protein